MLPAVRHYALKTSAPPRKGLVDYDRDLSAEEVAERTGVSRVTSRRYLDRLARSGLVDVSMRYGKAGRPEHRYRWSDALDQIGKPTLT